MVDFQAENDQNGRWDHIIAIETAGGSEISRGALQNQWSSLQDHLKSCIVFGCGWEDEEDYRCGWGGEDGDRAIGSPTVLLLEFSLQIYINPYSPYLLTKDVELIYSHIMKNQVKCMKTFEEYFIPLSFKSGGFNPNYLR